MAPRDGVNPSVTDLSFTKGETDRLLVVRYFLDRPGYGLHNSSARLWRDPPPKCSASDIMEFLVAQGIKGDKDLLSEVYLDKFECFMLLEVCEADEVTFDFANSTTQTPSTLNIRLTDISSTDDIAAAAPPTNGGWHTCSASPVGLLAFSMTVLLETADLYHRLLPGDTVDASFVLTWGPYAFWVSGFLQVIAGVLEWSRNNLFGATAFLAFGCFWMANGTKLILKNYFPADISTDLLEDDPVGQCIRIVFILAFNAVLFKATLVTNKLSSSLIFMLMIFLLAHSVSGWSLAFEWIQMISGTAVAILAFYIFTAEFLNEIYQKELIPMHPWSVHSPELIFGAAGRSSTLQSKVVKLRTLQSLHSSNRLQEQPKVHDVRSARALSSTTAGPKPFLEKV
jgi:uncharacterized protein